MSIFLAYTSIFLTFIIVIGLMVFIYLQMIPLLKGAPNVATTEDRLKTMLELADLKKTDVIVDLGSGDGTILVAIAKKGFWCTGIEIDPMVVRKSRRIIKQQKLENLVSIKLSTFWKTDLSLYSVVFVYGVTFIMKDLQEKLQNELRPGSRVISNRFIFPDWKPKKEKNNVRLYVKQ